ATVAACQAHVPRAAAKMVFDRLRLMRHVLEAVDKVRKHEHRALLKEGDASLAKTKYLWLYSAGTVPERAREHLEHIKTMELRTARPGGPRDSRLSFWNYKPAGWPR